MLQPPRPMPGDFTAEVGDNFVLATLRRYSSKCTGGRISINNLADAMKELGADWTEPELQEIGNALDSNRQGSVAHSVFVEWWKS